MPFLVRKLLKGKTYLYLRHNHRVNGKVKTAWQIYLGPEEELHSHSKIAKREIKTETIEFGLIAALFQVAQRKTNQLAGEEVLMIDMRSNYSLNEINTFFTNIKSEGRQIHYY